MKRIAKPFWQITWCRALAISVLSDVLALADPSGFYANPPAFLPIRLVDEYDTLGGDVITADNGKVKDDKEWSKWTPTITNSFNLPDEYLEDTVLDSTLLYFTYSKGFKSGGFEMKGLEVTEFEPESVNQLRIGNKSRRLRPAYSF